MPERWTRTVLRYQLLVVASWVAVLVVGLAASTRLPDLLSNSFGVPGTESERVQATLERSFGERPDGTFTVVFTVARPSDRATQRALELRLARAARAIPGARARPLRTGPGLVYGDIATKLPIQKAKRLTDDVRRALLDPTGPTAAVTGAPALQHDLDPIVSSDLRRAELIAVPIALALLVAVLGLSAAVLIPFLFAAGTIAGALTLVYVLAQLTAMATYVTNLVVLVGLALAIDYSLLVVHRYREEAAGGGSREDAVVRTMATAGRAVTFSGLAVAIGLGALLFVPVPFVRSLGIGGLLVPLVSLAAMLTLQPVLLVRLGHRAGGRASPPASEVWRRLARSVTAHPWAHLAASLAVLVAAAAAAVTLGVTAGSISSIPGTSESVRGFDLLRDRVGAGVAAPTQIVVDTGSPGGGRSGPSRAAIVRLVAGLVRDSEVLLVANGVHDPYVDPSGRHARVIVAARHDYGTAETSRLVGRIRNDLVPGARFPATAVVAVGGVPPQGVDFVTRSYAAFPWLVLAVLALTFTMLVLAFRSLVLPLQAVLLDLLSVAAAYGLLTLVVEHGVGAPLLGMQQSGAIEAWVPIALFAFLFGLSMDYEVFVVMPMREAWDEGADRAAAVARGLTRTGRIVTVAAAIMVAVFSGFVAGSVPGLQQFGLGLALGILVDATIVRLVVVPSLVYLGGRRSFWLPDRLARLAHVAPSPLRARSDTEAAPGGAASEGRGEEQVSRRP